MSPWLALILVVLAFLGEPLFVIFGAASMILFSSLADTSITGATNDVFSEKFADSPLLVTIPLFTFAGYLMAESGTPKRLVEVSRAWLGWLPGGVAIVCLLASAFFTTFTGGSGITIVAIGGLLYPALLQEEYPERFSLGLVTTGGSLGLLFPPSLPVVIYGVVAGITIEKLFLAGIVPGLLSVLMLSGYSFVVGRRRRQSRTKFEMGEALRTLNVAKWELLLPVVLLGGMYSGALRIHEAAAFTAIYTLIVEVFVYRDVTLRGDVPRIVRESMTLVGAILAILAMAIGFTAFLIQARVPMMILEAMQRFISSPTMFLFLLNIFLLVVGMLMDIFSAIVVVVPLIAPIAERYGIDPYHLGVIFLLNLEIGYLTPPVGLNLFISSFRFGKPVTELYRAVLVFIGILIVTLLITTYVPRFSTFLPDRFGGPSDAPSQTAPETPSGPAPGGEVAPTTDEGGGGLDALEAEIGGGAEEPLDLDALEAEIGGPDAGAPDAAAAGEAPTPAPANP